MYDLCAVALALGIVGGCVADVTWDFGTASDVVTTANLAGAQVTGGQLLGRSQWDPYVYLRVPEDGLEVSSTPYLTVRLYSSAEADVLDVYYRCSDGIWGLGATLPIRRGWATYRADLREATWHESSSPQEGRQWGGRTGRIVSFRIDPGNEADRWVVVDRVQLSSEPTGALGIVMEPRGTAVNQRIAGPVLTEAGQPIVVEFSCEAQAPAGLVQGNVLVSLLSQETPAFTELCPVDLTGGAVRVEARFPVSRWSFGGDYTVVGQVLELDGEAAQAARVQVVNPRTGLTRPPETRVSAYRGEPALYVDGTPRPLVMSVHYGCPPGPYHREMADAGIKVYSDWFGASVAGDLGQVRPGVYNYAAFDRYFAAVLDAVPDAYFLPHIGVVAPLWWQQQHPEECCLYSNGQRGPSSLASELWRQEMGQDLRRLIAHLQQTPYADRILGYIFYSGYTAEWQMWATWQEYSDDYSEPALKAFRAWLRNKYATDEALRAAWGNPAVSLDNAPAPTREQRESPGPYVRDPARERQVIDFDDFTSDMVADSILYFARVIKQATGGTQIAGTYYGYMAAHAGRQRVCGHNALARVLESPDVDFLMSPNMYARRELGGTSTFMSATESVKLHGKLWVDESDLRTYLSDPGAGYGRTTTPQASVAVTWREFANVLTRHVAVSWFDMAGGWFSGQPLLEAYAQQTQILTRAFARRQVFCGDVAVFVDERSFPYFRSSELSHWLIQDQIALTPRAGVTWDFYLLSDLSHPDLPPYKLYVVLNAVALSDQMQQALLTRAAAAHGTVVYMYAPGYARENRLDADRLQAITGVRVEVEPRGTAAYAPTPGTLAGAEVGRRVSFGPQHELAPRPVITDPTAEVLAHFTDGSVCMARKRDQGVMKVYCGSVSLPPEILRALARAAGAHVYCETNDALYTDGHWVALHASTDGEKIIRLPAACRVMDPIAGTVVSENTDTIRRTMQEGETLFLELDR